MNRELTDVQAGFRKGRETRDQIANICWIMEKAREFPKNIYFCFIDYAKAFDCVYHNKLWKILKANSSNYSSQWHLCVLDDVREIGKFAIHSNLNKVESCTRTKY